MTQDIDMNLPTKTQMDRLSGVKGWTWHDVRTAVATNLAKLGFDTTDYQPSKFTLLYYLIPKVSMYP